MRPTIARRTFLGIAPSLVVLPSLLSAHEPTPPEPISGGPVYPEFPAQEPSRAREMVGASHGNLARVTELLEKSPALAKATWDWGYGDWETAIGAASHVGAAEVARLLMAHGARPDIFTFAMLGELEVVRAYITANPGIQKTHGPHGLTLMHHARKGGDAAAGVLAYLAELGDADLGQTSAPLSESDAASYIGEYAADGAQALRMRVSAGKDGLLNIMRLPEGTSRTLYFLGNGEFHPTGARAVRVRFALADGRARSMTITDHELLVSAARVE